MMKRVLKLMIAAILAFSTVIPVSYASFGSVIATDITGNSTDIITIKRPESLTASTSDKTYTIAATGAQGTTVRVYKVDESENVGKLISAERQIGASGLYSTVVELNDDNNTFIVCAENSKGTQVVRVGISKIKKSTIDRLKSVTVTIRNFLS